MLELLPAATGALAWPVVLALAWVAGELGHRWLNLPRISLYGLIGFIFGHAQLGLLPATSDGLGVLVANIAFGLILFEFGYRINVRWLRTNPWLGATGVLETLATFVAVYALARWWGSPNLTALLLASLSMSTSPAALMRVINEQRSSGQVTERILHLAALNCVLAVFAFKVIVGFWTFESSGNLGLAFFNSLVVLAVSGALGAMFGVGVPGLLRLTGRMSQDGTVAFAIAVILLVGLTHAFKFSPLVAALTFGLVARNRRLTLTQTQRNFGALGDLLAVVLFAYVATRIEWPRVATGLGLGLALVATRLATKVAAVAALARASGISSRKGGLTGIALMPMSVLVVLLLEEHTRHLGIDLVDQLAPLAAATLLLELIGPVATQQALRLAGEAPQAREHGTGR
ncbi:MAG TPA: cation:proton antiporter [Ramlibacter sp.]|jgi:NhaP-type Na+/H+ or K+/H+ antiporter